MGVDRRNAFQYYFPLKGKEKSYQVQVESGGGEIVQGSQNKSYNEKENNLDSKLIHKHNQNQNQLRNLSHL